MQLHEELDLLALLRPASHVSSWQWRAREFGIRAQHGVAANRLHNSPNQILQLFRDATELFPELHLHMCGPTQRCQPIERRRSRCCWYLESFQIHRPWQGQVGIIGGDEGIVIIGLPGLFALSFLSTQPTERSLDLLSIFVQPRGLAFQHHSHLAHDLVKPCGLLGRHLDSHQRAHVALPLLLSLEELLLPRLDVPSLRIQEGADLLQLRPLCVVSDLAVRRVHL
mmetsp:Transcript_13258/g.29922  ORF Transcript_13258/g.29922 Transcript_13258/m.29922 type:complete len:225 (+) Transcript_13258:461-1135(+)